MSGSGGGAPSSGSSSSNSSSSNTSSQSSEKGALNSNNGNSKEFGFGSTLSGKNKQENGGKSFLGNNDGTDNIKKEMLSGVKKDPFRRNNILRRSAEAKQDNPLIKKNIKELGKINTKKTQIARSAQLKNNAPENTLKNQKEFEQLSKQEKKVATQLKFQMLAEDMKNAVSGPAGWAKGCKGCFKSMCLVFCLVGGGLITSVLAICGVI